MGIVPQGEISVPVEQLTDRATESDLESRIHAVLERVFPWLEPGSIHHQTKFSFRFGRTSLNIDGVAVSRAEARTDILLLHEERPLAVLELKRSGASLTQGDIEQGLSYARMLHPSPPLVVVTNGEETKIFASYTGEPWTPTEPSEQAVAHLFAMAGQVAAADMKRAMEVLLGPTSEIWVEAVRAASREAIAEMTGTLEDTLQPFAEGFLIPRSATEELIAALGTRRLVIVEGTPLSGKSNVLRELVANTAASPTLAVLYLDAGGGGVKVLQQLANLLSDALGWQVSRDEVRQWLRNLSQSRGPDLVIAVDGLGSHRDAIYEEIDELTSGYGVKLKVVIAIDDTIAKRLVVSTNGRRASSIGRKSVRLSVGPLSGDEFDAAMGVLETQKVAVMFGGKEAEEYRAPWVLRAVTAHAVSRDEPIPEGVLRAVPSMLGTELIDHAREVFAEREDLRRRFHKIACAVLEDTARSDRNIDEILQSVVRFRVRSDTLARHLESPDREALLEEGLIREYLDDAAESFFVVRLPELLAAEITCELANRAIAQIQEGENPAKSLAETARLLPGGDIIGAQTILDAAWKMKAIPANVILWFLRHPPTQKPVVAGAEGKMYFPGPGPVDVVFKADGVVQIVHGGEKFEVDTGDEGAGSMTDPTNWLILSLIAAHPFGVQSKDGQPHGRIDPQLLLEVGSCPFVLRRIGSDGFSSQFTHTIPGHGEIVCHREGIIEPIAMAIYKFLSAAGARASEWIEDALERKSLPLLYRIFLVLQALAQSTNSELAEWSASVKRDRVEPALSAFPSIECEGD